MIKTSQALAPNEKTTLQSLIARATSALASATTAAEVLEARDAATEAYDAAKRIARLAKAKQAHDDLIAAAHGAQRDALLIESQAKARLADEYDAAQARGEVKSKPGPNTSSEEVIASVSDIGLTHKQIHEARQIRDAEKAEPGITEKILNEKIAHGEEPTRAAVKKVIGGKRAAAKKAEQAEFDRQRDENKAKLPAFVATQEQFKADAIAAKKQPADIEALTAELEELRDANAALEAENASLKAELKRFDEMRVQFERGGFEEVIAGKDAVIAAQASRIERESHEKVANLRSAEWWKKKAIELGYSSREVIDLDA